MVTEYTHILAAVDLVHDNSAVIERAMEIARRYGAQLTLLNVVEYVDWVQSDEMPMGPGDVAMHKELLERAEKRMDEVRGRTTMSGVRTRIESGTAKHEVVRVAEEEKADLIVIGSHGRHGLQLLLGSTANGVLNVAKCDVLAVRIGD